MSPFGIRRIRRRPARPAIAGFTLIELMIVIVIMLTVTAVTIPVVAPAIQGQQLREGARILSTFLNAARNRAIESGRPAGVWIERMPGLREAAVNVYFAEVPPVYAGDFLDSSLEAFIVNGLPTDSMMTGTFFNYPRIETNCRDYWNIIIPRSRTTMNVDSWSSPDPMDQQIVRPGDMIQIEGDERQIPLKVVRMNINGAVSASQKNLWWYIYRGRNCARHLGPDGGYLSSTENRHTDGSFIINWFDRAHYVPPEAVRVTTWFPRNPNVAGLRYKIFRQPIKMQAGSVKMPAGVVIDLNYSSMTDGTFTTGTYTTGSAWGTTTANASGLPFHPRRDPDDKSNNRSPYWGDAVYPNDETPIIMVFSAGGHLERIYCRIKDGVSVNSQWSWEGVEPYGSIHFLIGKLERIVPHEQYYMSQDPAQNLNVQLKKNWLDLDNLWVNIFTGSGFITTSLVNEVSYNSGSYSAQASNPQNVHLTRISARTGKLAGGR